jgi:hypothetical protein
MLKGLHNQHVITRSIIIAINYALYTQDTTYLFLAFVTRFSVLIALPSLHHWTIIAFIHAFNPSAIYPSLTF